jgi:hypothetical protein
MKSCLLVFGLRYAGWYLQLSNLKPTQVCSAQAGRPVIYKSKGGTSRELVTSIQPLKRPTDYWNKSLPASVSLNCANNIISQLLFAFTGKISLFQWKAFRDKDIPIHLVTQSLKSCHYLLGYFVKI